MAKIEERAGARIYRFPQGGRAGREAERARADLAARTARTRPVVECGSGWYHEAAIRSERP